MTWKSNVKAGAKSMGKGIVKGTKAAYSYAQSRKDGKQSDQGNTPLVEIEPTAKTFYDSVTTGLIQIIGLVAPLLIAAVLTVGNGYFFSGFHAFSFGDSLAMWAYVGGGVLEAIGLGLVYRAARRYRKGDHKGMLFTFTWLLLLMAGSVFAQYMFLQGQYVNGMLQVPDTAAEHAPLFSLLVGIGAMRGHDIVFFVRALLFHVGELACSFVVVDKAKTASQIIAERREIHDAEIAMQRQELQLQREREEMEQDREIKILQHKWLLQQVRQGVVFVNAEPTPAQEALPSPEEGKFSEDFLEQRNPRAATDKWIQEIDARQANGNGHSAFPPSQQQ